MIKESKYQESTTINLYVPINKPLKYTKQNPVKLEEETDDSIVLVEELHTIFLVTLRILREHRDKKNKSKDQKFSNDTMVT